MIFWFSIAVVAAVWTWAVVRVLLTKGPSNEDSASYDIAVYKDQLEELDRDVARGAIDESAAAEARAAISRKLIAASKKSSNEASTPPPTTDGRMAALVAGLFVPAVGLFMYLLSGSPEVPNQPFAVREAARQAERMAIETRQAELAARIETLLQDLEETPDDLEKWRSLAQSHFESGNFAQAIDAFDQALTRGGPAIELLIGKGFAAVFEAEGQVTLEAETIFMDALQASPGNGTALYFLGLAHAQRQEFPEAAERWLEALSNASPNAPWYAQAQRQLFAIEDLMRAEATQPTQPTTGPTAEDMRAAESMTAEDRQLMIEGMVQGLAERLEDDPNDLDGWVQLARSYVVLGRAEDAREALQRARSVFSDNPEAMTRLGAAATDLQLAD